MTTTPRSPERPTRRKAWFGLGVVGLVFLVIFLVWCISKVRQKAGRAEIDQRLAAIRAAGEPVTVDDLIRRHPAPPPERDAARLLAPALAQLVIPDNNEGLPWLGKTNLPPDTEPLGPELVAKLRDLLAANEQALGLAMNAKLNGTWIHAIRTNDFWVKRAELRNVRNLGGLLLLKAVLATEEGDLQACVECLRQGLAVGQTLPSQTLIHHFSRRTVETRACEALERLLNRTEIPALALEPLGSLLGEKQIAGLGDALLEARCFTIRGLEQLRMDPITSMAPHDLDDPEWLFRLKAEFFGRLIHWSKHGYRDHDFVQILDQWARVLAAINQPPQLRARELKAVTDEVQRSQRQRSIAWAVAGLYPGFLDRVTEESKSVARLRTARVALAVLRWRAAHDGKLPESLAELVPDTLPAIPADPFDEQPLRYRRLPQGFTVYSVGPDFTDNGGQRPPAETEQSDGHDVVFTVGR